ncbi:MAG: FadR/GntR family transcriptional regulator [Acidimicrobiales bacterium]
MAVGTVKILGVVCIAWDGAGACHCSRTPSAGFVQPRGRGGITLSGVRSPKRPPRVRSTPTEALQDRIKQLILESKLPAGHPMPTEFELMEQLNVSRNPLREALKALQAVGIVEVKRGFGMYVGHMSLGGLVEELTFHGRLALQTGREDLMHLVEMREILERGLVEYVLERKTASHLSDLEATIEKMEAEAAAGVVSSETDRNFHELLYARLANPVVSQLLGAFWDAFHELQHDLPPKDAAPSIDVRYHRDIYEAVKAGDRVGAVTAMAAHFEGIRARLVIPTRAVGRAAPVSRDGTGAR